MQVKLYQGLLFYQYIVFEYSNLTWSSDIDVHAVVLVLALRRRGGYGGDPQVSCVQVLLSPLPMVLLVLQIQYRWLLKLTHTQTHEYTQAVKMTTIHTKWLIK